MRDCIQFVKRQKKRRNILKNRDECDYALIIPPSLERLNIEGNILEVRWGSYGTTPNIWFNSKGIAEKDIYIYINLSDPGETFNVLMLSSIIYRHDPKKIYIIIPFLDHGTQDRVEYEDEYDEEERRDIVQMESMAAVDTVAKIIPKGIKVITFDIHNIQSAWAYDNIINIPVLRHLFIKYLTDSKTDNQNLVVVFPDEGSYKRFSKDISKAPNGKHYVKTSIIFFKKRGLGDERIVQPMTDIESEEKKGYVIVDDMVRSGGTMKSVIKYLKDKENTLFVDLLFTHAAYESKTKENLELADRIWTTNTTGKDKSPQMLVADFLSLE
jgi:phosphoribosylpyrophosphate synthetase